MLSKKTFSFAYRDPISNGFLGNISSYDTGTLTRVPLNSIAVNGAVRFYCDIVKNWRWILPHEEGTRKAWERVINNSPFNDFQYFISSISNLSSQEKTTLKVHFLSVLRNLRTPHSNDCSLITQDDADFHDSELYPLLKQYLLDIF